MPMPGSFPLSVPTSGADKENKAPAAIIAGPAHGIKNKKRHRVSDEEEEAQREAEERAAKKRKNDPVPEGDALLAPRLTGAAAGGSGAGAAQGPSSRPGFGSSSPKKPSQLVGFGGGSRTPSPTKKKAVLSLSRLNMLARPKQRP